MRSAFSTGALRTDRPRVPSLTSSYRARCARSVSAEPERAAVLHGAADAFRASVGEVWDPLEADMREQDQSRLRELLGDASFEAAYSEGKGIGKTDAIALALHSPHGDDRE